MNSVNKTLFIPLYGKAYVSQRGLFLRDETAEKIWNAEGFPLKGKAKSKYLAFYMGVRAAVFDEWVRKKTEEMPDAVVIHIGCGMDSRILRAGRKSSMWYDVDFEDVIRERKRYFQETASYRMLAADIRKKGWLGEISEAKRAIIVMEGVSMYLTQAEFRAFAESLCAHFKQIALLADCYTTLAAKLSKYKNPVNSVGVTNVYGTDDPEILESSGLIFEKEHPMVPKAYIHALKGAEKLIFSKLYAGGLSKKLYRLFEYRKP